MNFEGRSFLDVGCGSGIHALAATGWGVSRIIAVEIDPDSVATVRRRSYRSTMSRCPGNRVRINVFDLDPTQFRYIRHRVFWGVCTILAICGKRLVRLPRWLRRGGLLVIALYRKTHLDAILEDRETLLRSTPRLRFQNVARLPFYVAAFCLGEIRDGAAFANSLRTISLFAAWIFTMTFTIGLVAIRMRRRSLPKSKQGSQVLGSWPSVYLRFQ